MFARRLAVSALQARGSLLRYSNFGAPEEVLSLVDVPDAANPKGNEVAIKMLAVPLHQQDLSAMRGYFGQRLPDVPGIDGVGKVIAVGPDVKNLKVDSWVVPRGLKGTLRTSLLAKEEEVTEVKAKIGKENAALLSVGPCTAYRLLHDFVKLNPGDVIIQNAGSGAVAMSISQIAKSMGVTVITIIKNRDLRIVERLKSFGSSIVVDEQYLAGKEYARLVADLPAPRLALDGAGGRCATDLARTLGDSGTLVCYGAMAKSAYPLPSSLFFSKNLTVRGFNLERWVREHSAQEHKDMLDKLADMVTTKDLTLFGECFQLRAFRQAAMRSQEPGKDKVVIDMIG